MYNPYEFMMDIRNHRILFQYLQSAAVRFSDEKGWSIVGETKEGHCEITELSNGIIRFSLPILIPAFVNEQVLATAMAAIQIRMEGLLSGDVDPVTNQLYIKYNFHITEGSAESLEKALLTFLAERNQIDEAFDEMQDEYKKIEKAVSSMMGGLGSPLPSKLNRPSEEANLDSLWKDMENIDKSFKDDEDEDEDPPKSSGGGNAGF